MTWAAHIVGAFYLYAGVVALRTMATDRLYDVVLAGLGEPSGPKERVKSLWLTFGAALTFASGVALLILSELAPGLFVANLAVQTGYLVWADRTLPPEEPGERLGRTRTINAALIYGAATVFAVWAAPEYARSYLAISPLPSVAVEFAIVLAATAGAYFYFFRKTRLSVEIDESEEGNGDEAEEAFAEDAEIASSGRSKALRVEPAIGCSPICDDFTGENVLLKTLPISEALCERIERWNELYAASQSAEDYLERGFESVEAQEAFLAEGEAIVDALRAEWGGTVVSNIRREW